MKKLLSVLLACALGMSWGCARAAECEDYFADEIWRFKGGKDVFWCGELLCDYEPVDMSTPPPNYDFERDTRYADGRAYIRDEIGYEDWWRRYFAEGHLVTWNGVTFWTEKIPPNYNSSDFWNLEVEAWTMYFNEMYYVGGPESALDERTYELFWGNLSYKGEKVDVMEAPPNYDEELDCWREERDEIGYAWYWEYYLAGPTGWEPEPLELAWNGIAFDGNRTPPNYVWEEDPYEFNRYMRGYMDYWARYFVETYCGEAED